MEADNGACSEDAAFTYSSKIAVWGEFGMSLFAYDLTTSPALLLKCSAQTGRIGLFHNKHMFQEHLLLSEWQIGQVQQPERPLEFGMWRCVVLAAAVLNLSSVFPTTAIVREIPHGYYRDKCHKCSVDPEGKQLTCASTVTISRITESHDSLQLCGLRKRCAYAETCGRFLPAALNHGADTLTWQLS